MAPHQPPKRKSVSGSDGKPLKQGTLFSFFSKKKPKREEDKKPEGVVVVVGGGGASGGGTTITPTDNAALKPAALTSSSASAASTSSASSSSSPRGVAKKPHDGDVDVDVNKEASASSSKEAAGGGGGATPEVKVKVGDVIQVSWKNDDAWYTAKVVQQRSGTPSYFLLEYPDDGESEWLDLSVHRFRPVVDVATTSAAAGTASSTQRKRKAKGEGRGRGGRRGRGGALADDEDSDDDNDEDDESASSGEESSDYYEGEDAASDDPDDDDFGDEEDEDEDQWMVTDDEQEEDENKASSSRKSKPSRLKKLGVRVHRHANPKGKATPVAPPGTTTGTAGRTPKQVTPALSSFSNHDTCTPTLSRFSNASSSTPATGTAASRPESGSAARGRASPDASAPSPSSSTSASGPPMFVRDAVNPAGSHVHNHLKFLQHPRDAKGRRRNVDDDYDPRTLTVVDSEWEKVCGSKMTNAVVQWWDLKKQYFDTVLLFKTGKFYEMFHMDADVGVQVCELSYMKGHVAHAGFPEISYASMADKLVGAGYKVARVEQTETPEQLNERKKRTTSGPKPKVVNREVCSILTAGTRTCCYLDQHEAFDPDTSSNTGSTTGPLLAISEVLLDRPSERTSYDGGSNVADSASNDDDDDDDVVRPVCEYGVTIVDALRGSVTVGQFADDVLRSRMNTLLATYEPSEILIRGGTDGASDELRSLLKIVQTSRPRVRVEVIRTQEQFPKSTAINPSVRKQLERGTVHPWDVQETLHELHRRRYYPQSSKTRSDLSVARWPPVLKAAVQGDASLLLSSFGAALFYLQRSLIDAEILSLGIVKAYIPPASSAASDSGTGELHALAQRDEQVEPALGATEDDEPPASIPRPSSQVDFQHLESLASAEPTHMSLDGTTLHNLDVLHNSTDLSTAGSLWSVIDHTKTPHGSRLLRAWLLRPLFKKSDIDRRADAVQELVSGSAAIALSEAQSILSKCGDIERLLARVHSMSGSFRPSDDGDSECDATMIHPNDRAVLYETKTYTKRKVADFSRLLTSLRSVTRIPEAFQGIDIQSGLLSKLVRTVDQGGCFPDMTAQLDWFYENFDCDMASKGLYEPAKGIDDDYDAACAVIDRIEADLKQYKGEVCSELRPRDLAKSSWKYINTSPDSKDKYLIELPVGVAVPDEFVVKGKRGTGSKQVNKYRTPTVEALVRELERALEVQKERKARGMQLIFAKFDSMRSIWASASTATALLDALGALAKASSSPGYTRPVILEAHQGSSSSISVVQGRHPCVEKLLGPGNFVPNDLNLGQSRGEGSPRVLLLSGVNMGGKSTCLRQTCLIAILAQIGCFVPAMACHLTPIDRIYTRLGASDRILLGQSTFFVELAETAAALRGATPRSLVIMDELGRGTSTFDGTAIASAAILHLVERSKCLSLFATHYHSLLNEWQGHPNVLLGHMKCVVENEEAKTQEPGDSDRVGMITFLYLLGEGGCPKSFGINVARLARLPPDVIASARQASTDFERTLKARAVGNDSVKEGLLMEIVNNGNWRELLQLHESVM